MPWSLPFPRARPLPVHDDAWHNFPFPSLFFSLFPFPIFLSALLPAHCLHHTIIQDNRSLARFPYPDSVVAQPTYIGTLRFPPPVAADVLLAASCLLHFLLYHTLPHISLAQPVQSHLRIVNLRFLELVTPLIPCINLRPLPYATALPQSQLS